MFVVEAPPLNSASSVSHRRDSRWETASESRPRSLDQFAFLRAVIEGFVDGLMLINQQGEVIESNRCADRICQKLSSATPPTSHSYAASRQLPGQIWRVCKAMFDSRKLFPTHPIILDDVVSLQDTDSVRIRAQWMDLEGIVFPTQPYLLVTLEDRSQSLHNVAIADAQRWGLTQREQEIWELRLQGCSYEDIGKRLYITQNTVKKHIKSILSKRRVVEDDRLSD